MCPMALQEKELAASEFSPPHRHDHLTTARLSSTKGGSKEPKEPWRAPISKIALLLPQT